MVKFRDKTKTKLVCDTQGMTRVVFTGQQVAEVDYFITLLIFLLITSIFYF